MAIHIGTKVKATCLNGEIYEGILHDVCIGIDKEQPAQASIIISEEKSADMKYGQVHIFCSDLAGIENLT